jgi:hypothetical protein
MFDHMSVNAGQEKVSIATNMIEATNALIRSTKDPTPAAIFSRLLIVWFSLLFGQSDF